MQRRRETCHLCLPRPDRLRRRGGVAPIIANKASVNVRDRIGMTPLHWATGYSGRASVLRKRIFAELLLASGADVAFIPGRNCQRDRLSRLRRPAADRRL